MASVILIVDPFSDQIEPHLTRNVTSVIVNRFTDSLFEPFSHLGVFLDKESDGVNEPLGLHFVESFWEQLLGKCSHRGAWSGALDLLGRLAGSFNAHDQVPEVDSYTVFPVDVCSNLSTIDPICVTSTSVKAAVTNWFHLGNHNSFPLTFFQSIWFEWRDFLDFDLSS